MQKENKFIDSETFHTLGLELILNQIEPYSAPGKLFFKQEKVFMPGEEKRLTREYDIILELMRIIQKNDFFYKEIITNLAKIDYIPHTIKKAENNNCLETYEIFDIKKFIFYTQKVVNILRKHGIDFSKEIRDLHKVYRYLDQENQQTPHFHISKNYSLTYKKIFEEISKLKKNRKIYFLEELEAAKKALNLQKIESKISVSRMDKQLIEKLQKSPYFYLEEENFANLIFVFHKSKRILKLETEVNALEKKLAAEERKIREKITGRISKISSKLLSNLKAVARFDIRLAKAKFGCRYKANIPEINYKLKIDIKKAINLPLKFNLNQKNNKYHPVDLEFGDINLLTGTNMTGKSTILRTVGQMCYLFARAIPLPAASAKLPLVTFIYFSGIQSDRMDLSSFGAEVVALNKQMTKSGKGLFLIDEFARGTNPEEGRAFASAILENFLTKDTLVIFTTHFTLPIKAKQIEHYRIIGLKESDFTNLVFDKGTKLGKRLQKLQSLMNYNLVKIKEHQKAPKAALRIAKILGIDNQIIKKAEKYMNKDED